MGKLKLVPPPERERLVNPRRGSWIAYNPAFRRDLAAALGLADVSEATVLVFLKMQWRFSQTQGAPFWKAMTASRVKDETDAPGGSWKTEMAMSRKVMRTAMRPIVRVWPTKATFLEAGRDAFLDADGKELPFASYFDRLKKRTFYCLNPGWNERHLPETWLA
jgi:hypothetical protein